MNWCKRILLPVLLLWATAAHAEDAYFDIRIRDLKFADAALGASLDKEMFNPDWSMGTGDRVTLEGPGEIYFAPPPITTGDQAPAVDESLSWMARDTSILNMHVRICAPAGQEVTGRLILQQTDGRKVRDALVAPFSLPAASASAQARAGFLTSKAGHYRNLAGRNLPGTAWFRHQLNQTRLELEKLQDPSAKKNDPIMEDPAFAWNRQRNNESTFDLFSGGQAVSENLQLDRVMPAARNGQPAGEPDGATIEITSIKGITVKEMDFTKLLGAAQPRLDPLASAIPADQHAVFFPSFSAAQSVADEMDLQGTHLLKYFSPSAQDAGIVQRYQTQLSLSLSELARVLGPQVISSLALTGSDPYFATGTDVAVLFASKDPPALQKLLLAQMMVAALRHRDAPVVQNPATAKLPEHVSRISPDRSVCTYLAVIGKAVVVTNSAVQLEQLFKASQGQPTIADLPEYRFFRERYPLGDAEESGLLFVGDATIRRWCGPQWRIASHRRTVAQAVLAEMQARNLALLAEGKVKPTSLTAPACLLPMGELKLTESGVMSSVYGTPAFLTPISELTLAKVTRDEELSYNRWRDGYQRNWSMAFDPLAFRLSVQNGKLSTDLSIMPLIAGSEYRTLVDLTRDVHFAPNAGDAHACLMQFVMSLNRQSEPIASLGKMITQFAPNLKIEPLAWLGDCMSVYLDDDPAFLKALEEQSKEGSSPERFLMHNLNRVPLGVYVETSNSMKLALFLTAVHAFVDQSAPNMTEWETLKYKDLSYVKIGPSKQARQDMRETENVAVYYVPMGKCLLLSCNEEVIKRAMDREEARRAKETTQGAQPTTAAAAPPADQPIQTPPWLGKQVALRVTGQGLRLFANLSQGDQQADMQRRAWSAIPILNEWKRLYPGLNPVEFHQKFWNIRLICPGGGEYVWNDAYQTMESTVYGHPGQPKKGPPNTAMLEDVEGADFGLTFENDGLRARLEILRKEK